MIIDEVRIRNFQAHEKLRLKLEPVTTIVGSSDAGKSAVIRAIVWVLTNKPSGSAMVRHGSESCVVALRWLGRVITRERGKENTYKLDGNELKAFGQGVPEEIQELTGITEASPQIQRQHDQPYWLSSSAGEVARQFNKIIGLDTIDSTIKHINGNLRKIKTKVEVLGEEREELAEAAEGLKWSVDAQGDLQAIGRLVTACEEAEDDATVLAELLEDAGPYGDLLDLTNGLDDAFAALAEVRETAVEAYKAAEGIGALVDKANELQGAATALVPDFGAVEELEHAAALAAARLEEFEDELNEATFRVEIVADLDEELKAALEELDGSVCPECGQEVHP